MEKGCGSSERRKMCWLGACFEDSLFEMDSHLVSAVLVVRGHHRESSNFVTLLEFRHTGTNCLNVAGDIVSLDPLEDADFRQFPVLRRANAA